MQPTPEDRATARQSLRHLIKLTEAQARAAELYYQSQRMLYQGMLEGNLSSILAGEQCSETYGEDLSHLDTEMAEERGKLWGSIRWWGDLHNA